MKLRNVGLTEEDINSFIKDREDARKMTDWAKADAIRNELLEKGIVLEDKPGATAWRVKVG
jgi:cysteinyl-tRNA synthetase